MARTKTTESLQAILPRDVSNMKGKKQFQMHVAFYNWEKIVGPQIAKHVKPVRMDFRTLFLYADAPAWAAQLRYMERDLIDKINAYVATELVTSIRYTNYIEKRKQSGFKRNSNAVKAPEIIPDSEDLKKAESSCSPIKDKEVRQAAERALAAKEAREPLMSAWTAASQRPTTTSRAARAMPAPNAVFSALRIQTYAIYVTEREESAKRTRYAAPYPKSHGAHTRSFTKDSAALLRWPWSSGLNS